MPPTYKPTFFRHSNSLFFPSYAPILCPGSSRGKKSREESKALPLTSASVITQPSNNSYCCLQGSLVPPTPDPPRIWGYPHPQPRHRIHIVIPLSLSWQMSFGIGGLAICLLLAMAQEFPLIFRNKCLFPLSLLRDWDGFTSAKMICLSGGLFCLFRNKMNKY